jgi:hypothetical protein
MKQNGKSYTNNWTFFMDYAGKGDVCKPHECSKPGIVTSMLDGVAVVDAVELEDLAEGCRFSELMQK